MEKNVYIEWNGCNRRFLDISKISRYLTLNGYTIVHTPRKAKYILLATCAFKEEEENHSIARIRFYSAFDAKLLIYGCLPDIAPSKFKKYSELPSVSPRNIEKIDLFFEDISTRFCEIDDANLITYQGTIPYYQNAAKKFFRDFKFSQAFYDHIVHSVKNSVISLKKSNKPYYLFVCRGCMGKCSYCSIKFAIGAPKSKPIDTVIQELQNGIKAGYENFIILGDDVGVYGADINSSFPQLLSRLLEETHHIKKSLAPTDKSNRRPSFHIKELHPQWVIRHQRELIALMSSDYIKSILCPVESGSDRILTLMKREHTAQDIKKILLKIRASNPKIDLSTQIIVGFPSETEEEFNRTLNLVKEAKFDSVVIFPYHPKENAPATRLTGKVPDNIIEERVFKARNYFRQRKITPYFHCPA